MIIDAKLLYERLGNLFPTTDYRIQLNFEKRFITFQFDWIDNYGFIYNICHSFSYKDVINFRGDFIKKLQDNLKKDIK